MVNAYLGDAGEQDVWQENIGWQPRYEKEFLIDLVFAETRGKAKAILIHSPRNYLSYAEFTDVKSKLVAHDVDRLPGLARSNDELWERVT